MVATRVGGLSEVVQDGETGILCEPDPASIAEALLSYFAPGGLPDLEVHLAEARSRYSWESFAGAILDFAEQDIY